MTESSIVQLSSAAYPHPAFAGFQEPGTKTGIDVVDRAIPNAERSGAETEAHAGILGESARVNIEAGGRGGRTQHGEREVDGAGLGVREKPSLHFAVWDESKAGRGILADKVVRPEHVAGIDAGFGGSGKRVKTLMRKSFEVAFT